MTVEQAFDALQIEADAEIEQVREARRRRDVFRSALETQDDVDTSFGSGSLARGTHKDPIHDVDVVIEFDQSFHPDWGDPGKSAEEALTHLSDLVGELLSATDGTYAKEVRLAQKRNHALKCFLDDPQDPDAFTVDVVPGFRKSDGSLWVPERNNELWIQTDPQYLINEVRKRHAEWNQFAKLVRVLKRWSSDNNTGMKSLLVEVLALTCLLERQTRPQAMLGYFTAAHVALGAPIEDPAGLCGPIQPDLDLDKARDAVARARDLAEEAVTAQDQGDEERAQVIWREAIGPAFPEPETKQADPIAIPYIAPRRVRDAPQG